VNIRTLNPKKTYEYCNGETGEVIVYLKGQVAYDCSTPGPCDEAVEFWAKQGAPDVDWITGRQGLIEVCQQTGAWTYEELCEEDDQKLRERVLWIAACEVKENPPGEFDA